MQVSVVGAGVAGLTAALALHRDGHDVRILERADALRATGFGLNLWSNATTLLEQLGTAIPGEPFDRVSFRAGGRQRAVMSMATSGTSHMNADRGAVVRALADQLPAGALEFGRTVTSVADLHAEGAELVVVADGASSRLRPVAVEGRRHRKPWVVWQAVLDDTGDLLEPGTGATIVGARRFVGLWRHPQGGLCWFLEEPALPANCSASQVLERLADDEDPLVVAAAAATPPERLGQWQSHDRWPGAIIGDRVAVVGDAAHPMLPCIGQGACTAIEDGVALAAALRQGRTHDGLIEYRRRRLLRMRTRVAIAHIACAMRRPSPFAALIASTALGRPFAAAAGACMRAMAAPDAP